MATKKRQSTTADLTIEVLKEIRNEIRELRTDTNNRFEALGHRFEALDRQMASLESETKRGFAAVTARLENLRDLSGDRYRDLEARLRVLEERRK